MKNEFKILLLFLVFLISCGEKQADKSVAISTDKSAKDRWKAEIMEIEYAFNYMAQKEGLVKAFEFYAADNGVIKRNKKIVKGKEAIAKWYEKDVRPNEILTWKPTFVDVSASGDMAYTYGDFIFTYLDSLGNKKESKGIFHTVWKRQADGNWRYVWD